MKIICTSNFDDETINDILIAENVNNYYSSLIADFLNDREDLNSAFYHKSVDDNYILHIFKPKEDLND